jgi:hypothetical protein
MKRALPLALLAIPSLAFALNYSDVSLPYSDAPFSRAESAGISILTEVGAVSGNPDGTFAPNRTVNRAEFLKILFLSHPNMSVVEGDAENCFPDVKQDQWFSKYVCLAQRRKVVGGYPDGFFRPENPVNYAEALKMLSELYQIQPVVCMGLDCPELKEYDATDPWYQQYVDWSDEQRLLLPINLPYGAQLTRGQVARLAASFRAHSEGELDLYRLSEQGKKPVRSSSNSSASSVTETSSVSSSSVSSLSSSSVSSALSGVLPISVSRFLLAGRTTPTIVDGIFTSAGEDGRVSMAEVELYREIRSLESLSLIDGNGTVIGTLSLLPYSNADKIKWRVDITTGSYILPKDVPVRLGVRAKMKSVSNGGASNELLEVKTWSINAVKTVSNAASQLGPADQHRPQHQTALGRITSVDNALASSLTVQQGANRMLGSFTVSAESSSGATVKLNSLSFILQSTDVAVSNLRFGGATAGQQGSCATEAVNDQTVINCFVPETVSNAVASPITLSIYADVTVAAAKQSGTVRIVAKEKKGIGSGNVYWTDGYSTFNWVEADVQSDDGPVVTVTK